VRLRPFADRMLNNAGDMPRYLECMAHLHMCIHAQEAIHFASLNVRLAANIAATRLLDERRRQGLLSGIADLPDGNRLCHGDFHPMNILGEISHPVIIDWLDARRGDPAADVCRSYLLLMLHAAEIAPAYLDAYCRISGMAGQRVLDWLPYVAAAKLAENVPAERGGLLDIVAAFPPG
jgi:thiamine kinase-like enzyme